MRRDQMEAHLTLQGWEPQTDTSYYHIKNADLDQCAYTLKRDTTEAAHISLLSAKYGLARGGDFDGSWQAIPDEVLTAMFKATQERNHEFFT